MSSTDFGEYNPLLRQQNIKAKLDEHFQKIRTNWLRENNQQGHGNSKPKERDSVKVLISDISSQVAALSREIDGFEGPHFTQKYRTLNEKCAQFQLKLDKIEIEGRTDAKQERKAVLVAAESAAKVLASKVHPDGKICPDCELKKL